ncbi:hAT family C-terminal dimerization region [Phytophthora infestans]|uniref:HAT family C-terminal dimerization region n=2 Tax=Phytophthora infestans TaxID=4787 RepID=A0A8S9U1I5_PHYIN|nr:hAT family C-terminal dimerization region [Phytophthora infestans]
MADVVVCYLDIFTGFSKNQYGSENLVREVEKRWRQCEQPLMLLALFLHPAHRQAAKAILDKTPLTSVCSLCRIGMYYFKRFNIGKNMSGLYEDLHNWIMNDDVIGLSFVDFSSVDAYWNCMRSEMPRSKLPDLALVILSIAVNTATCERYFSELALIHTAKRNRMSPDKARKLALVRKKVREYNAGQDDAKTSSKYTRLIDPTERTRLRYRDDRFECLEPEVDAEDGNVVGPDTAFEYWQAVLCELEDDDDPPVFDTTAAADNTGSPLTAAAASLAEEKRFAAVLETIKIQSTDPIPEGDRRPFPRHNDRLFPQEQRFPGLRGQKVTLAELSKTPSTPLAQPGSMALRKSTAISAPSVSAHYHLN